MNVTLSKNTKRKLTKLANLVEKMPPKMFDLETWSSEKASCGTSYCAVGYGVVNKLFDGLKLVKERGWYGDAMKLIHKCGKENLDAVEAELGIPIADIETLFTDYGYSGKVDRRAVVRRLRAYVKNPNNPRIGRKDESMVTIRNRYDS